ncbi:MAG: DUF58 domain-containing protein [Bacillota bacterium]|nr:DUF58 domain-containing protein [Bacillota bacterium]
MDIVLIFVFALAFFRIQRKVYEKRGFKNVEFQLQIDKTGIFEGEELSITECISNKKWLPLLWVDVQFLISANLLFKDLNEEVVADSYFKKDIYSLLSYERITKKFRIEGVKRGYYTLDEANLITGDLFVTHKYIKKLSINKSVYVYPRLISTEEFTPKFERLMGEVITKRHIIEDEFMLRGIRDYGQYDSMKAINWSASARTGSLKVNQYDYTSSQEVLIFVNVDRYNSWDPKFLIEHSIRIAASMCSEYLNMGIATGLVTNCMDNTTQKEAFVAINSGNGHGQAVYETLAALGIESATRPFSELIYENALAANNKKPLWIIISHYCKKDLQEAIFSAKNKGINIQWIIPKTSYEEVDIDEGNGVYFWESDVIE